VSWLYRTALRLVTRERLKSERTRLLLEKSWLLEDARRAVHAEERDAAQFLAMCADMQRVNGQLDAVNAEIGRRGVK
jgi:hypothetical protein